MGNEWIDGKVRYLFLCLLLIKKSFHLHSSPFRQMLFHSQFRLCKWKIKTNSMYKYITYTVKNIHYDKFWGSNIQHNAVTAAAKSLQLCLTLCDPYTVAHQAPPSLGFSRQEHWNELHFLLQCMKVKSESEFAQSYPTLSDPMDGSLPGSSFHGIFQARVLEWVAISFSGCWKSRS